MPAVSVLLPCFNAAATLPEALDSLIQQTLTDYEIIAVDDGSNDDTPQILAAYARREPRLQVLTISHAGIIAALNAGLAVCSASYVARMDADDLSEPERLERQVSYLDAHPNLTVLSCRVRGFPAGQVREGFAVYLEWLNALLTDAEIRREIFVESPLPHPSVMFRREVVRQIGGYVEHGWPEDYDLWLRLYLRGCRFAKLPETLLAWREHPLRLTRTDSRYSLENFLRAKAYYLARGPLQGRDAVFIWGAGMAGRRLCKQLQRQGVPLAAFFDIDPRKIGRSRRGLPILPPEELPQWWSRGQNPALLTGVGARGARPLIRQRLLEFGLIEGVDWWNAA
jgi:glycosyltransferase involved in cell wall biosynthesis